MKNHINTTVSMRLIQEGVTWPFLQKMGTTVQNPGEEKLTRLHELMQQLMPENAVVWSVIETVENEYRSDQVRLKNAALESVVADFIDAKRKKTKKGGK